MRTAYDDHVRPFAREVLPRAAAGGRLRELEADRGKPAVLRAVAEPDPVLTPTTAGYLARMEDRWRRPAEGSLRLLVPQWAADGPYGQHYRRLSAAGAQVRVLDEPQPQLAVRDSSLAVFDRQPHDKSEVVLLRDDASVAALRSLFDAVWRNARALVPPREVELDEHDTSVLRALATGATDLAVARLLGISERTLRRRVASLMDAFGAQSRFQLGALAAGVLVECDESPRPSRRVDVPPQGTARDRDRLRAAQGG